MFRITILMNASMEENDSFIIIIIILQKTKHPKSPEQQ